METITPPRQRRKGARPQELIDAALDLFVEKGFAATRSEEVAARAGVSKGTLYLYFPSKEELLKAVIREQVGDRIAQGAQEAEHFNGSMATLLQQLLTEWWQRMYDSPASGVFKLVITEVRNFPDIAQFYASEVIEPAQRLIGGILQRGIERGEFRPVDINHAVHSLVLPLVMVCVHKHSLGACSTKIAELNPHEFIAQHVALVLHGLLNAPAPARKH